MDSLDLKIRPLQPPDSLHLKAAEGWLELGNHLAANDELENIQAQLRVHPEVLRLRWYVYARAKKWEMAGEIAKALIRMLPDSAFGYIQHAYTLHEMKRTKEAWDLLSPIVDKFPDNWTIPYNLSCYAAQMGQIEESEKWFKQAMKINEKAVKEKAIDDPDLEPLWEEMRGSRWKRLD